MNRSALRPSIEPSSRLPSSGITPDVPERAFDRGAAKGIVVALAFACGLFALIAFLDGLAQPDDISAGTALAALPATPAPVGVAAGSETWAADTTAQGTRPDAIH